MSRKSLSHIHGIAAYQEPTKLLMHRQNVKEFKHLHGPVEELGHFFMVDPGEVQQFRSAYFCRRSIILTINKLAFCGGILNVCVTLGR